MEEDFTELNAKSSVSAYQKLLDDLIAEPLTKKYLGRYISLQHCYGTIISKVSKVLEENKCLEIIMEEVLKDSFCWHVPTVQNTACLVLKVKA